MTPASIRLRSRREERIVALVDEAVGNLVHAADMLHELLDAPRANAGVARSLVVAEQNGKRVRHDMVRLLAGRFGGGIESADLHRLVLELDRVVDLIEEIGALHLLYRLDVAPPAARKLAALLLDAARLLSEAWTRAHALQAPTLYTQGVKRVERDADEAFRAGLSAVVEHAGDPLVAIKHKDVLERLEDAIDAERRIADLLDGVVARSG